MVYHYILHFYSIITFSPLQVSFWTVTFPIPQTSSPHCQLPNQTHWWTVVLFTMAWCFYQSRGWLAFYFWRFGWWMCAFLVYQTFGPFNGYFFEGFVHWTHWTSNLFYHFPWIPRRFWLDQPLHFSRISFSFSFFLKLFFSQVVL